MERAERKDLKVLLVDDIPINNIVLSEQLKTLGFSGENISFAGDGLEAIHVLLKEKRIDLIITDTQMPKCDGPTLIEKLKSIPETQNIPIILNSGDPGRELIIFSKRHGVYFYEKPADLEIIDEIIQEIFPL